jgi:hypothetical protein
MISGGLWGKRRDRGGTRMSRPSKGNPYAKYWDDLNSLTDILKDISRNATVAPMLKEEIAERISELRVASSTTPKTTGDSCPGKQRLPLRAVTPSVPPGIAPKGKAQAVVPRKRYPSSGLFDGCLDEKPLICSKCGEGIERQFAFCPKCGEAVSAPDSRPVRRIIIRPGADPCPPEETHRRQPGAVEQRQEHLSVYRSPPPAVHGATHGVPALASFLWPGLGQFIKGHNRKGMALITCCAMILLYYLHTYLMGEEVAYIRRDGSFWISATIAVGLPLFATVCLCIRAAQDAYSSPEDVPPLTTQRQAMVITGILLFIAGFVVGLFWTDQYPLNPCLLGGSLFGGMLVYGCGFEGLDDLGLTQS